MNKIAFFLQNKIFLLLGLIVVLSFAIRVYKIDAVPPSLSWDEAAVGYNAYTIANWGRDEYDKFLPAYFRSFGEDKQPVHIYITAVFVKLFGLSEFSTRIPSAVFGSLNVLVIFFLARILFKNSVIGLFSSLFLAVSPQNIFFSRFNHEANFALFFLMLGLLLFYKTIKDKRKYLPLAVASFLLSSISYHAAEIVIPIVVFVLLALYFKQIYREKITIIIVVFILVVFSLISFLNPELLGFTRYNQTVQGNSAIEKTEIFKKTHNLLLGRIGLTIEQYSWHFNPTYLFISGGKNSRLSSQNSGEFYLIDVLFLILGLAYLLYKRSKEGLLIFTWAAIGPLPSSLFAEAPHVGRAMFMMGSWQIIAALGLYSIVYLFKKSFLKLLVASILIIILFFSFANYYGSYLKDFPRRYAIDWQYGMKQVVGFVKSNPEYEQVFMTEERAQPYIFFLYYLQTPLPEFLNSVVYNRSASMSSSKVSFYDKYYFGGWNTVDSFPNKGVLYVLTPSEYDGLKFKSVFEVKKVIYYPNNTTAFYLVSAK